MVTPPRSNAPAPMHGGGVDVQPDADVIVIGAGAVGMAAARALAMRGRSVLVLEKEPGPAMHQSGRNSGVLHAGYNLKPGSLKARFCVEGGRALRRFCETHGVAIRDGGILVVARDESDIAVLDELHRRAGANGTDARLVDEAGLRALEPHAAGIAALHAREGASFDARAYVHALANDALANGAELLYDTKVRAIHDPGAGTTTATAHDAPRGAERFPEVRTNHGELRARVVVNAAGLFADRLAAALANDVRVIPFRGYYAELRPQRRHLVRSHIYAAPDLEFPFLGVHLSHRADGRVIVGPGAMLAFGREAYRFAAGNPRDLASTLAWPGFYRMFRGRKFRSLVKSEVVKSLHLGAIHEEARRLVPELARADLVRSYAGNRAQLVARDGRLVDDIMVRTTDHAVHVLNAVSPGLTCSLAFGDHLADESERLLGQS